jgi:site-specific recombinase XerD
VLSQGVRHYFATVLIFGGANVPSVQLAMGHTTPFWVTGF